jgi:hypothetical protein
MKAKFGDKNSIQNGERVIFGYYKHNGPNPIVETKRDFESASYSETSEIPTGVYPIYAGWNHYGRDGGEGTLYVEFKGVVTQDYFPSSLGGVVYNQPETKNKGQERVISRTLNVADSINKTGNTPNSSQDKSGDIAPDIYIKPKYWSDILDYYKKRLEKDIAYFQLVANDDKQSLDEKLGMLRFAAACVEQTAKSADIITRAIEHQKVPMYSEYAKNNTKWLPKENSKPKVREIPQNEIR